MQKRIAMGSIVVATLLAAASGAGAQSPDPWIGAWKVSLAKSTYSAVKDSVAYQDVATNGRL